MKKIILLFVVLLLLCSCVNTVTLEEEEDPTELLTECPPDCSNQDYGVVSELIYPSETIRSGLRITPSVDLTDVGDSDASGKVCLTNLDNEVFDDQCLCQDFDVTRREVFDDEIGVYTADFDPVTFTNMGPGDLSVLTKYEYTTFAPIDVCLTDDPGRDQTCDANDNMVKASSGPLEVMKVYEDILPSGGPVIDLVFTIEVEKPRDDEIVSLDYVYEYSCYEIAETYVTAEVQILFNGNYYTCDSLEILRDSMDATTTCVISNVNLDDASFLGEDNRFRSGKDWIEITYGVEEWQTIEYEVV